MSPTDILARWSAETPDDWPPRCLEGARRAFIDTVAVMLAGAREDCVRAVRNGLGSWSRGTAFAIGGERLAPPWAALVNGTAAHSQDFDDVLDPAMSHPSAALVPALLGLGEDIGASGGACLDAYLVGFEVMARLGEAMNLAHYRKGWHTTLSLGAPGVAAACGRLLRLDRDRMQMAISLATSMAGGSKRQFGAMAKPLHAGLAAKNGMLAALLAAGGVSAAEEPLEGPWGYVEMTAGAEAPGFGRLAATIGQPPAMEQHGLWLKLYPCCASTHRPVDAVRAMQLAPESVARIEAEVSDVAAANLRFGVPANPSQARFSLPYCVAAAIIDGMLTPASFTDAAIARPRLPPLMRRVSMTGRPAAASDAAPGSQEHVTVTVRLEDGAVLTRHVAIPHGHPNDPLTPVELAQKFLACADAVLSDAAARDVLDLLAGFDTIDHAGRLTARL